MDTVDMNLSTPTEVTINSDSGGNIAVGIEDVKKSDVLDNFDAEDVCGHFDHDALLKEIGQEKAVEYFGLELKEDE